MTPSTIEPATFRLVAQCAFVYIFFICHCYADQTKKTVMLWKLINTGKEQISVHMCKLCSVTPG